MKMSPGILTVLGLMLLGGGVAEAGRFGPGEPFSVLPAGYYCSVVADCCDTTLVPGTYAYAMCPKSCAKNTCTYEAGQIMNAQTRDLLFFSAPPGKPSILQALQAMLTPGLTAPKTHTAACKVSSGTYCTQIKEQTGSFDFSPDIANCGGLAPNACVKLQDLYPGITSTTVASLNNGSWAGMRFRPVDTTLQNTIQNNLLNGSTTATYKLAGFTSYVPNSQCSQYFADASNLTVTEGHIASTTRVLSTAEIWPMVQMIYNSVYDLCREVVPGKAKWCIAAGGRKGVCERVGHQVVNAFFGHCDWDYQYSFSGIHDVVGVTGTPFLYGTTANQATELNAPRCGDGICVQGMEDAGKGYSCPKDCPVGAAIGEVCGDQICTLAEEQNNSCATDCPKLSTVACGNGECNVGETVNTCPSDCKIGGDGVCSADESQTNPGECPEATTDLGHVSMLIGKVNLHGAGSSWSSDPDCASSSGVSAVDYCKKWWPGTTYAQALTTLTTKSASLWRGVGKCASSDPTTTSNGGTEFACIYSTVGSQSCVPKTCSQVGGSTTGYYPDGCGRSIYCTFGGSGGY